MSSVVISFSFVAIRDPERGHGSALEGFHARGCVADTIVVISMINRELSSVERLKVTSVAGHQSRREL